MKSRHVPDRLQFWNMVSFIETFYVYLPQTTEYIWTLTGQKIIALAQTYRTVFISEIHVTEFFTF